MLKVGKLDNDTLRKIVLEKITYRSEDVIERAKVGEDCAVLNFGEHTCVLSTDPITASVAELGNLAVLVSLNDIASNGVKPFAITLTLLLPVGTEERDIEKIMEQAGETAKREEVEIVGGHTEITNSVNKPVAIVTAIGKGKNIPRQQISSGDFLVLTKRVGIEGTGIIATDMDDELRGILSDKELREAQALSAMTSVTKEGILAGKLGITTMHDVTEGGVLGAAWEVCENYNLGCLLYFDKIPVYEVTQKIADYFHIDPFRLISSGSMLISAPKDKVDALLELLESEHIEATVIGKFTESSSGKKIKRGQLTEDIMPPESDELYKVINK